MTSAPGTSMPVRCFHDEVGEVVQFLSYLPRPRVLPSLYSDTYLRWKISENPFGHSTACLRYKDGKPAAHCSLTAKPANDDLVPGMTLAELGDTHTHPDFQRQGHFSVLGRQVIEDFTARHSTRSALIYGLPNENALPGWTKHCGCVVMEGLEIREVRRFAWRSPTAWLKWATAPVRHRLAADYTLTRTLSNGDTEAAVGAVWSSCDRSRWLIAKDSKWWRWRYAQASEHYDTRVMQRVADGAPEGWLVIKRVRSSVSPLRRVTICDVVARTEELEAEMLRLLLERLTTPLDVVRCWVQDGTALSREAGHAGFVPVRDVPVIFAANEAYATLCGAARWFRLSSGDTDNV